jgi:tripartite-type tricarboxylate transporter receptor subunit TctC
VIRRLAATAFVAAALLAPMARAADAPPGLTIIEPYGTGSVTDRIISLYKPGLEKATGHPVAVEHDGAAALEKLTAAPPNGHTIIVVDLLSVEIAEAAGQGAAKISALAPIAKLTGPGSVALVVADSSPIKSWADFAAAAKAGPLTIAAPGRVSAAGVPLALMEKALGVHFKDVAATNRDDILAALAAKKADAAFLITVTLLPGAGVEAPPVRPLVTFGAQRNPRLAQVPTFQEQIGKPHNSITTAIAAFGPAGLDAVAVKRLTTDFVDAGRAAKSAPGANRLMIDVGDAALLRQTMERDARIIKEVEELLH